MAATAKTLAEPVAPGAMMGFGTTEWPFGWLATHLLHTVCSRIGMFHAESKLRYKVDHYQAHPEKLDQPKYLLTSSLAGIGG